MDQKKPSNLFIITILLLLLFAHLSRASTFTPRDHHLINCGSAAVSTADLFNRKFTGDESKTLSKTSVHLSGAHTVSIRNPNPNFGDDDEEFSPIYQTARVFTKLGKYSFPVSDRGTHFVRIHFHPFNFSEFDVSCARFHVLVNGYLILHNFNVNLVKNTVIKEYILWVDDDDDEVEISFIPSGKAGFGFVNAIEVISAPKDLILGNAKLVKSDGVYKIGGLSRNGFETMYRVNVGGLKVTPFNDSLWRTWIPDDQFLYSRDGSQRSYFSGRINYQVGGASREVAPDFVYNTARVITSSNGTIPRFNLSWGFPVVGGYEYMVRAHFCDIRSIVAGLLYFNVYVNGNLAYEDLDLSRVTYWRLASPFYADLIVNVGDSDMITVSVGPSNWSNPNAVDAILNGLEVFKLNNSLGSFDGEVSPSSILKSCQSGNSGFVVPLLAVICLFVAVSIVLRRGKLGIGNSVAWSRLPLDSSEVNVKS